MAEDAGADGEEKKSSKMMIIIIAVVVLLAGGGGAYYFMFMGDDTALEEGAEAEEEVVEEVEEEEDLDTALTYFDMPKPFVVNFPKSSGIRLLQVSISLATEGEASVEVLKKHEPMIRNNLLMLISGQAPSELKTVAGKQKLQEQMLKEVGKIMKRMDGKNKVQDVFFTSFVMQ
ncbi:MAG: flagellar FliL protein [Methyloprofundus sp.]|nr:MAG: flagellar FliL protein [Methyloprofundus sp.]